MSSMKKTALLAVIGAFVLGLTLDQASAGEGRRHARTVTHQGAKIKIFHQGARVKMARRGARVKISYKTANWRRHKARRQVRVVRNRQSRWRGNPRRWTPPRKHYRKTRQWDRRRYYSTGHKHRRHRGHNASYELTGTVIGAALGAILGNSAGSGRDRTAVIIGGAVIGGIIGNRIGKSMDDADQDRAAEILETSRTGQPVEWTNPDTGGRYTMTPVRTYRNNGGEDCREYTVWGWIDGYEEKLHGTACRTDDGIWQAIA